MDRQLFRQAMIKFATGLLSMGVLLFIPAGTPAWPAGWLLVAILFIPMFIGGMVLLFFRPALLRKRLNVREEQPEQIMVIFTSAVVFIAAFVLAGLNFRFRWIVLPGWVSRAASAVFLLGFALYAEVIRENEYLSRVIEVQENQKVVDTGLYGIIRHPMYLCTLIMFLAMPFVLGSVVSFAVMLLYIPVIVKRIRGEERVLEQDLPGYAEYEKKVRYRLVPYVW